VMLRIHRHADDIVEVEHLDAWVHRVARSAIIDFYRRRAARPETPVDIADDAAETIPALDEAAETDDAGSDLAGCLSPLIARLPEKYREALELTEIGGLSQVEAAQRLGLSTSGMKARVQRARGRLRELLLQCCHVELDRRGGVTDYEPRPGGCGPCAARSGR